MTEYILQPSKTDLNNQTIQISNEIEPIGKTNLFRIGELDAKVKTALTNVDDDRPEISLKLYNFMNKLYRDSLDIESKNKEFSIPNNEVSIKNIMNYIPIKYRKKANILLSEVLKKEEIDLSSDGVLKNNDTGERVAAVDLLLNVSRRSNSNEHLGFYRNLISKYPSLKDIHIKPIKQNLVGGVVRPTKRLRQISWVHY